MLISVVKIRKVYFPTSVYIVSGSFRNSLNFTKAMIIANEDVNGLNEAQITRYYSNKVFLGFTAHSQEYNGRANVSYFYNYETEENYGYYWIDDWIMAVKSNLSRPSRNGKVIHSEAGIKSRSV